MSNLCQMDGQINVGEMQMTKFSSNWPVESTLTAGVDNICEIAFTTLAVTYHIVIYTGESCFEVKIEADNNDITEHPHDDKPTVCHKRFVSKGSLRMHRRRHTGENMYSCNECEKCFSSLSGLSEHMNIHRRKYDCTNVLKEDVI